MWDLPGPGFKPVSPALAGGFLTTAPPGKPLVAAEQLSPCATTAEARMPKALQQEKPPQ